MARKALDAQLRGNDNSFYSNWITHFLSPNLLVSVKVRAGGRNAPPCFMRQLCFQGAQHAGLDRADQRICIDRFYQMYIEAGVDRALPVLFQAIAGQCD